MLGVETNKYQILGISVWETHRTAWTEHSEKKTEDIKYQAGKSGRSQIVKGFGRNVKELESEFYSKYHRKPLKNLM